MGENLVVKWKQTVGVHCLLVEVSHEFHFVFAGTAVTDRWWDLG